MYTKIKRLEEGFTIVETLIVLAIAALILTIVLIAVPDLQRSARNSDIKTDADNIASGIQTYEGNNGGALPTNTNDQNASSSTPAGEITIGSSTSAQATAQVQSSDYVNFLSGYTETIKWAANPTSGNDVGVGYIIVDEQADCTASGPGPASGSSLTPDSDTRAVAVYYPIENSSGGSVGCIQE